MFQALQSEVEARFDAIDEFFGDSRSLRSDHIATIKGLVFVQIYAVYEYTVNSVVSAAIDAVVNNNLKLNQLSPSLMALFLDAELSSLRDGQKKNEWANRLKLLRRAHSKEVALLPTDTAPPSDGSHYRYSQLELIFEVFGIKRMAVRRQKHKQRIAEVVGHRNAIAHGRESAEDIGRRYTHSEIRTAVRQMKSVCLLLINVLNVFCANPNNYLK